MLSTVPLHDEESDDSATQFFARPTPKASNPIPPPAANPSKFQSKCPTTKFFFAPPPMNLLPMHQDHNVAPPRPMGPTGGGMGTGGMGTGGIGAGESVLEELAWADKCLVLLLLHLPHLTVVLNQWKALVERVHNVFGFFFCPHLLLLFFVVL